MLEYIACSSKNAITALFLLSKTITTTLKQCKPLKKKYITLRKKQAQLLN